MKALGRKGSVADLAILVGAFVTASKGKIVARTAAQAAGIVAEEAGAVQL